MWAQSIDRRETWQFRYSTVLEIGPFDCNFNNNRDWFIGWRYFFTTNSISENFARVTVSVPCRNVKKKKNENANDSFDIDTMAFSFGLKFVQIILKMFYMLDILIKFQNHTFCAKKWHPNCCNVMLCFRTPLSFKRRYITKFKLKRKVVERKRKFEFQE